jgi:hypothetical protein
MVVWSRKAVKLPDGRNNTVRMSHLMRSTDEGKTWTYFSAPSAPVASLPCAA